MKEELVASLKTLLADTYAVYFKAHGHHWNGEGMNFPEYHRLFGDIYESIHESIDPLAESIRALDAYAPYKMSRIMELTNVPETEVGTSCQSMSADILSAIQIALGSVYRASEAAESAREFGVMDMLGQMDSMYKKWAWQLRVSIKE